MITGLEVSGDEAAPKFPAKKLSRKPPSCVVAHASAFQAAVLEDVVWDGIRRHIRVEIDQLLIFAENLEHEQRPTARRISINPFLMLRRESPFIVVFLVGLHLRMKHWIFSAVVILLAIL